MKLRRIDLNELGDRSHKPNVKCFFINFRFLDGTYIDMMLRNLNILILIHGIPNNVLDFALTLL